MNNVPLESLPRRGRVLEVSDLGVEPQALSLHVPSPESISRLQQFVLRVEGPGSGAHDVASADVDHLDLNYTSKRNPGKKSLPSLPP